MPNRYFDLDGSEIVKDTYGKIEEGFDSVQGEVDAINGLIGSVSDAQSCSSLGMVANSETDKDSNATLLKNAFTSGRVLVDGVYHVGDAGSVGSVDVEIIGITENAELIFDETSQSVFLDSHQIDSLVIDNVKITNNGASLLFGYSATPLTKLLSKVHVTNSKFKGNVSLIRQQGDTTVDPDVTPYGIEDFKFNNNECEGIDSSFVVLTDTLIGNMEVKDNKVKDFQYTFFNVNLTNGSTYESKYKLGRPYAEVKNNIIETSDDHWGASNVSYYTFMLFEGYQIDYMNNHVEGLKSTYNLPMYSEYLSAEIVNSFYNTIKNNIVFNENKGRSNVLIKSKQGGIGDAAGDAEFVKRTYKGNTYIVEEDFAARVGQSPDLLHVGFYDLTAKAENYVIEDNTFEVYDMRFSISGSKFKDLLLARNKFKCKYASGNVFSSRIESDVVPRLKVQGNSIDITDGINPAEVNGVNGGVNYLKLLNVSDGTAGVTKVHHIDVVGNIIRGAFTHIMGETKADEVNVEGNGITVDSATYVAFAYSTDNPEINSLPVRTR